MPTIQVDKNGIDTPSLKGSHEEKVKFKGLSAIVTAGLIDFYVRPLNLQLGGLCMIKLKDANGAVVGEALIEDINQVQMRLKYTAGASGLVTKAENYIEYEIGTDSFGPGSSVELSFSGNLKGSDGVEIRVEPNGGGDGFYTAKSERGGRTIIEMPIEAQ